MNLTEQIAKQFRDVYYGGNWTWVNFKDVLNGITWEQSTTKVHSFNTVAALVYHVNYYVRIISKVLDGEPLIGSDKFSFNHQPILSARDWENLLISLWSDADGFAKKLEQLPESRLWETFSEEKYGNYYRNLHGVIEHCHYHLGQIVLIKKILFETDKAE